MDESAQRDLQALLRQLDEGDALFDVEDILDTVTLPPHANPWPPAAQAASSLPKKNRSSLRKSLVLAGNIVLYVICIAMIALSVTLRFNGSNGSVFGYHIYHVASESMTPTVQEDGSKLKGGFRKNDAIIVKNTLPENVEAGDIITFWADDTHTGETITHRVLRVYNNGGSDISFRTKGDHNQVADTNVVPGSRLVGVKVLVLPKLGGVLKSAQNHPWITAGVSMGVLAAVFAVYILSGQREKTKKNAAGRKKSYA